MKGGGEGTVTGGVGRLMSGDIRGRAALGYIGDASKEKNKLPGEQGGRGAANRTASFQDHTFYST